MFQTDADGASNSGSVDGLGFDDIDEIDTNQMQIYNKDQVKNRRPDMYTGGKNQPQMKQEPVDTESAQLRHQSGKSLLKNIIGQDASIDADMMLNTLNEAVGEEVIAGTSGNVQSSIDPNVFDPSQVSSLTFSKKSIFSPKHFFQPQNSILDDELFSFDGETGKQEKNEDLIVTKYNPKHISDIQRLSSVTDYTSHLDNVQNDLDSLKDLLRTDNYQLDANQLMGVS